MARRTQIGGRRPFPWLLLLTFVISVLIFWFLPYRIGPPPVRVEFSGTE